MLTEGRDSQSQMSLLLVTGRPALPPPPPPGGQQAQSGARLGEGGGGAATVLLGQGTRPSCLGAGWGRAPVCCEQTLRTKRGQRACVHTPHTHTHIQDQDQDQDQDQQRQCPMLSIAHWERDVTQKTGNGSQKGSGGTGRIRQRSLTRLHCISGTQWKQQSLWTRSGLDKKWRGHCTCQGSRRGGAGGAVCVCGEGEGGQQQQQQHHIIGEGLHGSLG